MKPVYFAQKAFVVDGDRLLVVQRSESDPNQPLRWEVPGGRLNADEDIDSHIEREVWEETGIRVAPENPFFAWQWRIRSGSPNEPDMIVAIARLCRPLTKSLSIENQMHDDYLRDVRWISINDIDNYDWIPNMRDVLDAFRNLDLPINANSASA
jgi:8-oxo-dGTP pyrophosphatase MutT (NUDIX family)